MRSTLARITFGLAAFGVIIGAAAACDVGSRAASSAVVGDASLVENVASCPCEVGDSTLVHILACNTSACVSVNGKLTGYRCEGSGVQEDDSLCVDAGPCVPKTCADLGSQCAYNSNGCNADYIFCGKCPAAQFCTQDLSSAEDPTTDAWACWVRAESIAIYGNVQGGELTIDIDQDIPNLAIGVTTEQTVNVTITGQYQADVAYVYYVGEARAAIEGVANKFVDQTGGGLPEQGTGNVETAFADATGANPLFYLCSDAAFSGTYHLSAQGSCTN